MVHMVQLFGFPICLTLWVSDDYSKNTSCTLYWINTFSLVYIRGSWTSVWFVFTLFDIIWSSCVIWLYCQWFLIRFPNDMIFMSFSTYTTCVISGAGTTYPSVVDAFTRVFCWIRVTQLPVSFVHLMPSHCHLGILYGFLALFVLLFICFWPLCCMFCGIWNLITPLVSSNYSCFTYLYLNIWAGIQHDFYIAWCFMPLRLTGWE